MKYHIVTYGCQMNKNDSERIAAVLEKCGMKKAKDKNSADFIVINTCSVRQMAEDRVFGEVRNLIRKQKTENRKQKIAVTGCVIGRDKDGEIKKKLKGVDLFFKIDELPHLKDLVIRDWGQRPVWSLAEGRGVKTKKPMTMTNDYTDCRDQQPTTNNQQLKSDNLNLKFETYLSIFPKSDLTASRYLTIQTGCNEFCSYCVVPYARGRELNRPLKEILKEAKKLIKESAIEITLLGQIVNKWVAPDPQNFARNNPFTPLKKSVGNFSALLWELNQLKGLKRLSFISPHPRYMTDELIETLALPKIANYLHLPIQSGDDEILRKMNRRYAAKDYLEIIKKIRKVRPNIELGTDIIVGFPGETEEQFKNTVKLCKKVGFNVAYIAMYSPRSGTSAYKNFPDDIPHKVKKERWNILNNLINQKDE